MITWSQDYDPQFSTKTAKKGKSKKIYYKSFMALDTETSWNHNEEDPIGWIYQWCFRIEDTRVLGRTPSQFIKNLRSIETYIKASEEYIKATEEAHPKYLIFVHNLSYDICYLVDFLIQEFGKDSYSILALKPHKFITFTIGLFEFRCTYKLSNRSLAMWAKDLGTESRKLEGTVDYSEIHYQDEELPSNWWEYQIADVDTLYECIEKQLKLYHDSVATLPLTSTGYVRRVCRRHFKEDPKNRARFEATKPSLHVYDLLLKEFAGAISHGNRFQVEKTIHGTIRHRDFVSHYPSQQRTQQFPVGKFNLYKRHASVEDVAKISQTHCCLLLCRFQNIELRDKRITMPCLSMSKCLKGKVGQIKTIEDNGRVLKLSGIVDLVFTEIDLQLFRKQYKVEYYDIIEMYTSTKGTLPKYIRDTVDDFMYGKTKYKELEKHEEDPRQKADYHTHLMKEKNGLNGIYGMSAEKNIHEEWTMTPEGEFENADNLTTAERQEKFDKYYENKKSFMRFAFGCWTTSHARAELLLFCELIGWENVIYCDTDSAFYLSTPEIEERIEAYNEKLQQESLAMGAYIEYEGKVVHYNSFDLENEEIVSFRFLHSKCYAYEVMKDGKKELKIVIAGVPAEENAITHFTREDELGNIDNLKSGFVFTRCGGTTAKYTSARPFLYEHGGHIVECASACIIEDTTKTLKSGIEIGESYIKWEVI